MSGSASLILEQGILQHTLGIAAMAFPARVYVALCAASLPPSESVPGVEAFGGGYTRVAANFALLASPTNTAANAASVEFPLATAAWGELGYFEIWTAQTGGSRLYWGGLVDPVSGNATTLDVAAGDIVRFSAGTLAIEVAAPTVVAASGVSSFNARQGDVILSNSDVVAVLPPSANPPQPDGVAAAGTSAMWARGDHVHPGSSSNVLNYGADPTGVADSTAAIRAALAVRPAKSVYLPAGTYRITNSLAVGGTDLASQTLYGDGAASVLVVDADFNPSATGVILTPSLPADPVGNSFPLYGIRDLVVSCLQAQDFVTTTTVAASTGATTLTLASVTGVRVGNYAYTPGDAIPAARVRGAAASAVVTNVTGNVVTFSKPLLGNILVNAPIYFAPARAQFAALGTATSGAGGTGVKYPWVINSRGSTEIANVLIGGAWDGIYIRGSGCRMLNIRLGAFDIGWDLDQSFNWHMCDQLEFWGYGIAGLAVQQTFYDGQTVAANFGETDGMMIGSFGSFVGMVNLTANWTWGQFGSVGLDSNHSCLNVIGTSAQAAWLQIGNLYTSHGPTTITPGINITGPCSVYIANANIGSDQEVSCSPIAMSNGRLAINGGYIVAGGTSSVNPIILVTGGHFSMNNMVADTGGAGGLFLHQSGPNGTVQLRDISFEHSFPGATAVLIDTDNAQNVVTGVGWNGWGFIAPGNLGYYEPSQARPYSHKGGFAATGTTQATAALITAAYTTVFTVPAGSGVIMPIAGVGTRWVIWNSSGTSFNVYPPVGWSMSGGAMNAPIVITSGNHAALIIWDSLSLVLEYNGPPSPT